MVNQNWDEPLDFKNEGIDCWEIGEIYEDSDY